MTDAAVTGAHLDVVVEDVDAGSDDGDVAETRGVQRGDEPRVALRYDRVHLLGGHHGGRVATLDSVDCSRADILFPN